MSNLLRRYILTDNGREEITHEEYLSLFGEGDNKAYATQVYQSKITLDDVPDENREAVQAIVDARIAKFGTYENQQISPFAFQKMVKEVL